MSPRSNAGPEALRSEVAVRFFMRVMRRQLAGNFRAVRLARPGLPELPEGRPVMIYANHPSWWDPALFIALQGALFPGRIGFGPIDGAMLERYPFMARIGLFGVAQDSRRGAAEFLRQARGIVAKPDRVLWITAQGRFADPRARPLALRPGAAHLVARAPGLIAVPMAIEYPFWSEKKPEALVRFGAPVEAAPGERPAALAPRMEAALTETADALAELAMARDAAPFETLIGGARGTGGVYGLWQRGRAALKGERYSPDHAPEAER
ncbi:lysophospholipid acyltransferase family protein [Pseudoroseicyclus tamaricis]|uniref:Acyltransferase n=1 Tax=Pseudoroseicyclus tamaricis TaxID=2705421 RepID=A0A6B2JV87_9RHOB|nr:lysophospholipid acyltransferase family protein [Pseudoroseicyclus tamaricis]NDV02417.1 acyltransferase [Pseudoroseicyclus tamaricis]